MVQTLWMLDGKNSLRKTVRPWGNGKQRQAGYRNGRLQDVVDGDLQHKSDGAFGQRYKATNTTPTTSRKAYGRT